MSKTTYGLLALLKFASAPVPVYFAMTKPSADLDPYRYALSIVLVFSGVFWGVRYLRATKEGQPVVS